MKITIKDIAKMANVSVATVSKVINKKDDDISDSTKERIMDIVKKENYIPNIMARSLITKKTNTIGLIIPDISNPFFPELARGVEDKANDFGYNVIICNTDNDNEKEKNYLNMLSEKMVDGVILTEGSNSIEKQDIAVNCTFPLVLVDRDMDSPLVKGKIMVNDFMGSYMITQHLIKKNHKNIIFAGGPQAIKSTKNRFNGYTMALKENSINVENHKVFFGDYKVEFGYKMVQELINTHINFSAIVCGNDLIAIGAIKALKESGYKIPEDVAVSGFDDIYLAQFIEPTLTTVVQPSYEMGASAAEVLIRAINLKNSGTEDIEVKEINTVLKVRESS